MIAAVVAAAMLSVAGQAVPPTAATATTTTTTAATERAREFPGVIGWTGIALGGAGLVVGASSAIYAGWMAAIESDPASSGDDKQLAFQTHGVAGTVAVGGFAMVGVGALVVAAGAFAE